MINPSCATDQHTGLRSPGERRVWLLNLGLVPYPKALDLQHRLVAARKEGRIDDVLILLEHPPVITLGRRADETHVIASHDLLARHGISVHRVERGGDVTYHGPGQIVGYPILDLRGYRKDVGWYVRSLEEVLLRVLARFGIEGSLKDGLIGVWVGEAKVAAIGARIENWITYHGFALNVDPDMSHFQLIVPCGIADKDVISISQILGRTVQPEEIRPHLAQCFGEVFDVALEDLSPGSLAPLGIFL